MKEFFTTAYLEARLENAARYATEAGLKLACDDPASALQCLRVAERIIGEVVPELELRVVAA